MFCQHCGAQIADEAVVCVKCGVATTIAKPHVDTIGTNDAIKMLVPIGRSGWAIAAGYMGLFSVLPFVGIIAIILGIVAVKDIKKHPDKLGIGRAWFGIVMGAITFLAYSAIFAIGMTAN